MPKSLFSKLQVRLKRLPRLDGPESTDESEDQEELAANALLDGQIVDSAPSRGSATGERRQRAVRFSEDPVVPPPPCPFPSSSPAAALPPKPQSPQPAPPPPLAQLSPIYGEWGDSATNNQNHNNNNVANEHSQPPRPARWRESGNPPATSAPLRANLLLQQLRTSAGDGGEESRQQGSRVVPSSFRGLTASAGSPASTHQQPQICVFLEHQGETKRSALPSNLRSVDQLKGLFLRSFAAGGLSPAQLQSPTVKVYIQKPNSPHGLFYELEQLGDLVDQSVLRLFEQSPPSPLPPPAATFCHRPPRVAVEPPIGECLSEPEILDRSWNDSFTGPDSRPLRPASVLGNGGRHRRTAQGPTDPRDCWGGHSSDSSSCSAGAHYPKSGSSTPREEREETRRKVDSLERQLSSLCSLVHSALFPRHEILGTELAQFRAQILDSNIGGASGNGGSASLADSMTSTLSGINQVPNNMTNKNRQQSMGQVLSQLDTMRAELEALRRDAQRSARLGQEMIQRALHQARGLPEARGQMLGTMSGQANSGMRSSSSHLDRLASVQSALRTFEASLENTRSAVLNSTRRLKLDEVDELAARLGEIGREAVELKVEIPALQREFESEMRQTVERLATEEQKLREKLPLVDACLRRCKTLANMMVTMKKLAIIQDEERPAAVAALPFQQQRRTIPVRHISLRHCPPPSMATVQQQQPNGGNCHPLDQILDELNANKGANEISASFTLRLGAQQKPVGGVW